MTDNVEGIKQATGWEKIFAKNISDKEPLFKIYKELLKLNNNNITLFKNEPETLTGPSPKKMHT